MPRPKKSTLQARIESEKVESPIEERSLAAKVEKSRIRQKKFVLDLRIHSPASLGYLTIEGIDTAPALVRLAVTKGLDMIAVTDYYSGAFIDRVIAAAQNSKITVLPGVDLRCVLGACDDLILSCMFPEGEGSSRISAFLAALQVPASAAGDEKFLLRSDFEFVLETLKAHGGIAIPSRIDKTPARLSVVSTLVERYGFRAFDIAYPETSTFFKQRWPKEAFQLLTFSCADALAQVGSRVAKVKMSSANFAGLAELIERESAMAPTLPSRRASASR